MKYKIFYLVEPDEIGYRIDILRDFDWQEFDSVESAAQAIEKHKEDLKGMELIILPYIRIPYFIQS